MPLLRRLSRRKRRSLEGYLYISPWIAGFLIFMLGPMLASLWLSFTDYSISWPPNFIGLANYTRMLSEDSLFWDSLARTFYFATVVVVIGLSGSLACAFVLNARLLGKPLFRALYFIPSLTPIVALAIIWSYVLQPQYGLVNGALSDIGVEGPGWLTSPRWAIPALILMNLWATIGGARMIVFLAGLQGIPQELYDAADVDGANGLQRFWYVTLPMLSPTIFYNLVVGIIAGLRVFAGAYVTTGGGPAYATWFYILHLYANGFRYLELGYASALAWFFFAIVLILTIIQFSVSRRWVYYGGESK